MASRLLEQVSVLSFHPLEFFLDLLSADLGIAYRGLNGRRRFLGDVPKVVIYFFQWPTCLSCSMGEVMPKIMEG